MSVTSGDGLIHRDNGARQTKCGARMKYPMLTRQSDEVSCPKCKPTGHLWAKHPDSETFRMPFRRVRVCGRCKAQQTWECDTEWMRIVRRYWYPKVERCKQP